MNKRRGKGEGTIRQRKDGTWEGRYTLDKHLSGKQNQPSVYGKTRKEVSEKLAKILNDVNTGVHTEPSNMSLAEWLDTWLMEYKKDSVKPTTFVRYQVCAKTHIAPALGKVKLKDLRPDMIQKFINSKLKSGYVKKNKARENNALSPRSVQYIHITLRAALEQAVKSNIIVRNVADAVNLPKRERSEIKVLDIESQGKLIDAAYSHEYGVAVHIAIMTGMRLSEVLALTWNDIDFDKRELKVNKNLQRIKESSAPSEVKVQNSTKTKAGNRMIPIHEKLYTILKNHYPSKIRHIKNNFIIIDKYGNPIEPKRMTNYFNDIVKAAEIERITFHVLRHTFATRGLENGIEPKVMQEILGHTSITMTLDLYSHVLPNTKKAAIDKLKNVF